MKIAIVGAGAIGGMLTAVLAEAGADPLLIARGATLEAIRRHGLTFIEKDHRAKTAPRVSDDPAAFGPQDLVVIAVKAHQIEGALPAILPLVGSDTRILTAINGMPWWFFQGMEGPYRDRPLRAVDPTGALTKAFDPARLIGCGVYLASVVEAPYTVVSSGVRRLVSGAVQGPSDALLGDVAPIFEAAGIPMPVADDIRTEVMNKLMGNLWANPLSVVTGATMTEMTDDPAVTDIGRRMMQEFDDLCDGLGIALSLTIEKRLEGAKRLGPFRTSMLQDYDRGRALELEAILGAPIEAAEWTGRQARTMRTVYALTRLRAQTAGCV